MVECANLFFVYYDSLHFNSKKKLQSKFDFDVFVYSQIVVVVRCSIFTTSFFSCPSLLLQNSMLTLKMHFNDTKLKIKWTDPTFFSLSILNFIFGLPLNLFISSWKCCVKLFTVHTSPILNTIKINNQTKCNT